MQAFVHTELRTLAPRIMRWCLHAWEAATEADMIGRLDDQTLQELGRDCAVTPDQRLKLTRSGPHAADEMAALMLASNMVPAEVGRLYPAPYRDVQIKCSMCGSKIGRAEVLKPVANAHLVSRPLLEQKKPTTQ